VESEVKKSTDWQQLGVVVSDVMERLQQRQRAQVNFAGGTAKAARRMTAGTKRVPEQLELPLNPPARANSSASVGITAETMR
jgi:hypothetical protein